MATVITLSSGHEMPVVGLGTSRMRAKTVRSAVKSAILEGYRHIDTAKVYGNEEFIGAEIARCVAEGLVERKDLFITSKVWNDDHRPEDVARACRESLKRLKIKYLDLYLVHWPMAWAKGTMFCPDFDVTMQETWTAMEKLVREGLVKSIGVSNFGTESLGILLKRAIPPAVNQIELHPRLAQRELVRFCQENDVAVSAWSPLCRYHSDVIESPCISAVAETHRVEPAQVVLRWHLERGIVVIPRSQSRAHIRSNADVFSFSLTESEKAAINALDKNQRIVRDFVGIFENTPRIPWRIIGAALSGVFWIWFTLFFPRVLNLLMPQRSALEMIDISRFSTADALRSVVFVCAAVWVAKMAFVHIF